MYKLFGSPQTVGDAVDVLDRINDLIQFVADLTVMPTTPDNNEYCFSSSGYTGLYYFCVLLQEMIADCNAAISKTPNGKEKV